MRGVVRIGTRGSSLAIAQSEIVRRQLGRLYPGVRFKRIIIRTRGDQQKTANVSDLAEIGIFTNAIERALLKGTIDMAVHSLKDLPTKPAPGLRIAAFVKRDDPRDVLITRGKKTLRNLKYHARVGTSSLRRERQLRLMRDDLRVVPIRGNVPTRVRHVLECRLDAVILAHAGLLRLGGFNRYARVLSPRWMVPCAGQGVLGVEIRSRDRRLEGMVGRINSPRSEREARAERAFLKTLRGGCKVPVGVVAQSQPGNRLKLDAVVCSTRNSGVIRSAIRGVSREAERLGVRLARRMLSQGAGKFLEEARRGLMQ